MALTREDIAGLSEADRRTVLTALVVAMSADGQVDAAEVEALTPMLPAGVGEDVKHARAAAQGVRGPSDVVALAERCAKALAPPLQEKLIASMRALAWADGNMRPEEQAVLGAFVRTFGVSGENVFAAVAAGRLDVVTKLLDSGTPVRSSDPKGWTLLHVAVATGHLDIVSLLLTRGADVHARHGQGSVPLLLACNKPLEAVAQRLIEGGARVDDRNEAGIAPIHVAATFGQIGVLRVLRKAGAALEMQDASGQTALYSAAFNGRADSAAFLLAEGARVDARSTSGCTPLHAAATNGDRATVARLLEAGADANARDEDGQTPLHYAAGGNNPQAVALLIGRGARAGEPMAKGATPLHFAARGGWTTCAQMLLDAGAPVDARNVEGGTPLFSACIFDRRDVIELLAGRGADWSALTTSGTTPRGSIGAAVRVKPLRAVTLTAFPPESSASFDPNDLRVPVWLNAEGTKEQVLLRGQDARGRPVYALRQGFQLLAVTEGARRWLPVFTTSAAAAAFTQAVKIGWPEDGFGIAAAVMMPAGREILQVGDLPVDGVLVDGARRLTLEACDALGRG